MEVKYEVDVRFGSSEVMRVSDIRIVQGAEESPYRLVWILEGKTESGWEYIRRFSPCHIDKIPKNLEMFRKAFYYSRCGKGIAQLQIEYGHEISWASEEWEVMM